ncbi:unnamed protein product [Musa acuminata var. zebrina]
MDRRQEEEEEAVATGDWRFRNLEEALEITSLRRIISAYQGLLVLSVSLLHLLSLNRSFHFISWEHRKLVASVSRIRPRVTCASEIGFTSKSVCFRMPSLFFL